MSESIHAAPKTKKPWRTLAAGLLLLGTAGSMMVYGAPAHASSHVRMRWAGTANAIAAHGSAKQSNDQEGALVPATLLQQVSAKSVRTELAGARVAPGAPALGGGEARYGVDAYRVTYRTVDANGRPVVASGLVAFPAGDGTAGSIAQSARSSDVNHANDLGGADGLPVVSYDHGTTATSADTPVVIRTGPGSRGGRPLVRGAVRVGRVRRHRAGLRGHGHRPD